MPSLLFINRVHPPVPGATGQLLAELGRELVRAGWAVTVLTAAPREAAPRVEQIDGVRVERVAGLPFTRASHWRRALSYLSLYPAILLRALRMPRRDLVITLTDPPLLVLVGWIVCAWKRCRAVHWAQDLYPELAEELGVLARGGRIARALRRLSTQALRRCDRIIVVGRCMAGRLRARGIPEGAIEVISNWGHGTWSGSAGDPEANPFRRLHGLASRFVVMYSGNFGMAHPFEAMVEAAARMQAAEPSALFLFVGDGPRLPWVRRETERQGLKNVRFLPFQPRERLAESLGAADLHLASMEDSLCGLVVPSKVPGVLSAGRPCIFLGPPESEAARLIREHDFGDVLPQPDGARLTEIIASWIHRPDRHRWMQERAAAVAPSVGLPAAVAAFDRAFRRLAPTEPQTATVPSARPSALKPAARASID